MPSLRSSPRFRRFAAGAMAVLGVSSLLVLATRPRPKAPAEPTASLDQLVRVEGVLVWRDDTNRTFSGWLTEQYTNGILRSRSHALNGRLDGVSEGWNSQGTLVVREHFAAGISEGMVSKWHPDGSRLSEGVSRGGRFEGAFRRWHANGVLAEELELVAGLPHGVSKAWYPSGNLMAEARLEHGKVLSRKHWKDGERPAAAGLASAAEPSGESP